MTDFSSTTSRVPRADSPFKVASRDERSEFAQFAGLLVLVLLAVAVLAGAAWAYHDQQAVMAGMQTAWSQVQSTWGQVHGHVTQWFAQAPAPSAAVLSDAPQAADVARTSASQCAGATPEAARLMDTVVSMTNGILGKMLSVTMLLMGGAVAVVKNDPLPALTGVMGATVLGFGPSVIQGVLGC